MDLSKYKVKHDGEHHYEIEGEDGKSFSMAKHGLSKDMHDKIKKYCMGGEAHYTDGTDAGGAQPEDIVEQAAEGTPSQPGPTADDLLNTPNPVTRAAPALGTSAIPNVPINENVAQEYSKAIKEEKGAAAQKAVADISGGRAAAQVEGDLAGDQKVPSLSDDFIAHQEREKVRLQNQDAIAQKLANSPDTETAKSYFSNLSTPGKISTIFGLVLGGLGAGPSGVNQAVNVLNSQISQDVEAQKLDRDKLNTLYGRNLQAGQSDREASLNTQSQLLSIARAKLAKQASLNQTPQAQAAFQLANAALDKQQAGISQQLFINNLHNKIATGGPVPADYAPFASNPQAVVNMGDGTIRQASSPAAAGKVSEIVGQHQPALDTLSKLEQLAVNPIRPLSPEYQQAKSLSATLLTQLKGATGLGRLSPEAIKVIEQSYNNPTELKDLVLHNEKTQALKQSIKQQMEDKMAPYLPGYRTRSSLQVKPGFNAR